MAVVDDPAVKGKQGELPRLGLANAQTHPHTAAMFANLQTRAGQAAYRKHKWIAEPANEPPTVMFRLGVSF